jgi:hypothetical protein
VRSHHSSYDEDAAGSKRREWTEVVVMKLAQRVLNSQPMIVAPRQQQIAQLGHHEKALVELNNALYSDLYRKFGIERASQLQYGP